MTTLFRGKRDSGKNNVLVCVDLLIANTVKLAIDIPLTTEEPYAEEALREIVGE